jgi:hypothetical protein
VGASWYARNGHPWIYARQAQQLAITNGSILIDGVSFSSTRLQKTLHQAEADSAVLVAVTAGPKSNPRRSVCGAKRSRMNTSSWKFLGRPSWSTW